MIKRKNLCIIILILLYHISFISFPYLENYLYIKYSIIVVLGIYLLFKLPFFIKNKKYLKITKLFFLYFLLFLISAYSNRNIGTFRNSFLAGIVYFLILIEGLFIFYYFSLKNKYKLIINTCFYLTLFYLILTDTILLIYPTLYLEKGMLYLIGNKFTIAYLHIQIIILFLEKCTLSKKKKNYFKYIFYIIGLFICKKVECSTGIIGIIFLSIIENLSKKNKKLLKNEKILIVFVFFNSLILLLFSKILKINIIRYFIENILHEDITLTGRTIIYEKIPKIILERIYFGYGYGNSFEITMKSIGAPNTQNGLLEIILEQGIFSTIIFIFLIFKIFKNNRKIDNETNIFFMIYVYIFLSSIEITYDISFFYWLIFYIVANINIIKRKVDKNGKFNNKKCDI